MRVGGWDVGRRPPLVLGVEAAGVVAAVREEVASLAPGDEVLTQPVPLRYQGRLARSGWSLTPHSSRASQLPFRGRPRPRFPCPRSLPTRPSLREEERLKAHYAGHPDVPVPRAAVATLET